MHIIVIVNNNDNPGLHIMNTIELYIHISMHNLNTFENFIIYCLLNRVVQL